MRTVLRKSTSSLVENLNFEILKKQMRIPSLSLDLGERVNQKYFHNAQEKQLFTYFVWRDCKEESKRFENQLSSVVEKLSLGKVSGRDLSRQNIDTIVEVLLSLIKNHQILFVFDNADHYVNLESGTMTSGPDKLYSRA